MVMDLQKEFGRAAEKIFPITIYAVETRHYTSSSSDFRKTFLDERPKGRLWYAYDVVIHSRTRVEFIVYDMRDNVYGGIGSEQFRFEAEVDAKLTRKAYDAKVAHLAEQIRDEELRRAELDVVRRYAKLIKKAA